MLTLAACGGDDGGATGGTGADNPPIEVTISPDTSPIVKLRDVTCGRVDDDQLVALGDPVGRPEDARELAWRFREICDRHGGWTIFYEVGPENLPLYLDLGLSLLKLGEEARVPLENFSLEGGPRKARP